jgi:serine/threonine-protein kinase
VDIGLVEERVFERRRPSCRPGSPRAQVATMSDETAREALQSVNDEDRLSLRPGSLIAGAYQVDRVLGVGGMGTVVAARSLATGEVVAIKFMLPHFAQHQQLLVRFQREARATERVQSRHVRRVIYAGEISARMPYIVMEYLDGEDLRSLVKREGPLEPRQAAAYVHQACTGLAEAHALGIVHRDMKPANLFLARRPDGPSIIKVLDFGVAKFDSPNVSGDNLEVTEIASLVGSRYYMAPEQIINPQGVNVLADVWALGAILHYLLTGSTPFAAATAEEVLVNVLREPPHRLDELRPDVPIGLVTIVKRCLAKSPKDRYANVTELARALIPFMRAHDEESVPSARFPKEFSRTVRLMNCPIPPRAHAVPEATTDSTTAPIKRASAAMSMKEARAELETEPGHTAARVIAMEDLIPSAEAPTVRPPPMSAPETEELEVEPEVEARAAEMPSRASEAPTLFLARSPPRARAAQHSRGVVLGWIASAIVGGLIALAVGRPPAVQATSALLPPAPTREHTTVTTALVTAPPPIEKPIEEASPSPSAPAPTGVATAAVKAAPTVSAAPPRRPRSGSTPVVTAEQHQDAVSKTPLFQMPDTPSQPAPRVHQAAP